MVDGIGDARDGGPPDLLLQSVAGPAARALVQSAAHAELLVVGARGVGGVRGVLPSSVSLQCAHHAPCPTVVVRGAPARERVMATAARHAHEP
jgi:nucleotide-binding universal stress UspA family protein